MTNIIAALWDLYEQEMKRRGFPSNGNDEAYFYLGASAALDAIKEGASVDVLDAEVKAHAYCQIARLGRPTAAGNSVQSPPEAPPERL